MTQKELYTQRLVQEAIERLLEQVGSVNRKVHPFVRYETSQRQQILPAFGWAGREDLGTDGRIHYRSFSPIAPANAIRDVVGDADEPVDTVGAPAINATQRWACQSQHPTDDTRGFRIRGLEVVEVSRRRVAVAQVWRTRTYA